MNSTILASASMRASMVGGCSRRQLPLRQTLAATTTKPSRVVAMRSKPEEHFEPQEIKVGECLLEDARDAMEACKGLSPEDEAACMLALGCDSKAVHQRLDGEEEEQGAAAKAQKEASKK